MRALYLTGPNLRLSTSDIEELKSKRKLTAHLPISQAQVTLHLSEKVEKDELHEPEAEPGIRTESFPPEEPIDKRTDYDFYITLALI